MFFKEVNRKDSGDTIISNIFIDIFMPMANGLYVRILIMFHWLKISVFPCQM